jgi:hypothetical protein
MAGAYAHLQSGAQPTGQVLYSFGALQCGPCSTDPCGSQHSSLPAQHSPPQQLSPSAQVLSQGGLVHAPLVQYSPNGQGMSHEPQCCGSFCTLTQCSAQQLRPSPQPVRQVPVEVPPVALLPPPAPPGPELWMGSLQLETRIALAQPSPANSQRRFMRRV